VFPPPPPLDQKGGGTPHLLAGEGVGGLNSDDWTESRGTLYTLCAALSNFFSDRPGDVQRQAVHCIYGLLRQLGCYNGGTDTAPIISFSRFSLCLQHHLLVGLVSSTSTLVRYKGDCPVSSTSPNRQVDE
jgi:hypothetical protein